MKIPERKISPKITGLARLLASAALSLLLGTAKAKGSAIAIEGEYRSTVTGQRKDRTITENSGCQFRALFDEAALVILTEIEKAGPDRDAGRCTNIVFVDQDVLASLFKCEVAPEKYGHILIRLMSQFRRRDTLGSSGVAVILRQVGYSCLSAANDCFPHHRERANVSSHRRFPG